jgi:hypothetical protein
LVSLTLTVPLRATTYAPARIASDSILVQDGNVVFVQPGDGVTVLDAATGTVRLRTPPPRQARGRYELFRTGAGVLVSAWEAFRMVDVARPAIAWTLEGCDVMFHLAREGLVCVSAETSFLGARARFVLHRLTDGKALWTYRASDDLGGEVLDGRGRLMLTSEDLSERETFQAGAGTLTQSVRRVVGLTVLDLASGRELLPRIAQDVKLDRHVREPIRFDGDRITYVVRRARGDSCEGERKRVLTLNTAASAYAAEELCEAPREEARKEPDLPTSVVYMSAEADQRTRRLPGASVTLGTLGDTTLVDVTSDGRRWLAAIPMDRGLVPELALIREDGRYLFLESQSANLGRLDAFDTKAGRPLWSYIFPSFMQMASTTSFLRKHASATIGPDAAVWGGIQTDPPRGAFPLPLEALSGKRDPARRRRFQPGAVAVILDPGRAGPAERRHRR